MAGYKLAMEVILAYISGRSSGELSTYVKVLFSGQSAMTSIKKNTTWNEKFYFDIPEKSRTSDLVIKAFVYNVDQLKSSETLLGKVQFAEASFVYFSDAVPKSYTMKCGMLSRSKGYLRLKVYLVNDLSVQPQSLNNSLSAEVATAATDPSKSSNLTAAQETLEPMDAVPKEITPSFQQGMVVEVMHYLFVRIVKAQDLPDVDAAGSLNPFVQVKVGASCGITKYLKKDQNPQWNTTFAFTRQQVQSSRTEIIVKDKDKVRDDFVGMVCINTSHIRIRHPSDHPITPQWYPLVNQRGLRTQGNLMLAIWFGLQSDEAYLDAWSSGSSNLDISMLSSCIRPKMYNLPNLWRLMIRVIEAESIVVPDVGGVTSVYVTVMIAEGNQRLRTRSMKPKDRYFWNEEFMLVVAEPFEDDLVISCRASRDKDANDDILGQVVIPLASVEKVAHDLGRPTWFNLQSSIDATDGTSEYDELPDSSHLHGRLHLRIFLDGGYRVLQKSICFLDDPRPTVKQIERQPIGSLEVGILRAESLRPTKTREGTPTVDPYVVAKYGDRWARTRTLVGSFNPVFNEQYTWDVYDTATILTVGVLDNCQLEEKNIKHDGGTSLLGKVHIRVSCLQIGHIYAHSYPLLSLQATGVKKMGVLHLAVRFSSTSMSLMNIIRLYSCPILPKLHYYRPLSEEQYNCLFHVAVRVVASRLSRMEPPLREEVVKYLCNHEQSESWSLRKSVANMFRIRSAFLGLIALDRWFRLVRSWKDIGTTLLAHAIFIAALSFPELILPTIFLSIFTMIVWNYWRRPMCPPHYDLELSAASDVDADILDEEFDSYPSTRSLEVVRARYDRLRTIAEKMQKLMDDVASLGERMLALVSWKDPSATTVFGLFILLSTVVVYYVPYKVIVGIMWFYVMRHPRFRGLTPPLAINFFNRLPTRKACML